MPLRCNPRCRMGTRLPAQRSTNCRKGSSLSATPSTAGARPAISLFDARTDHATSSSGFLRPAALAKIGMMDGMVPVIVPGAARGAQHDGDDVVGAAFVAEYGAAAADEERLPALINGGDAAARAGNCERGGVCPRELAKSMAWTSVVTTARLTRRRRQYARAMWSRTADPARRKARIREASCTGPRRGRACGPAWQVR